MSMCERCRVPGCLLNYMGKACKEARQKHCPDVVYTNADHLCEMDDIERAYVVMCQRDEADECEEQSCEKCAAEWMRQPAK